MKGRVLVAESGRARGFGNRGGCGENPGPFAHCLWGLSDPQAPYLVMPPASQHCDKDGTCSAGGLFQGSAQYVIVRASIVCRDDIGR